MKTMFKNAGLDPERPPRTIQELDAFAEKLTLRDKDGNITQIGFMPMEPGWWNWSWGYFFGGRLWDGGERITANAPENIQAFGWIESYTKKYGVAYLNSFRGGFGNFDSPQNGFLAGKVAMEIQGVWMYNFIDKHAPGLQWGAAPFPTVRRDMPPTTVAEADILAIPNGAAHPREAFEFIKFVNSQHGMELLCMGQRKFTPLRKVSREFLARHPNPYIKVFIDLAKSPGAFTDPPIGIWNEYSDEVNSAIQKVWLQQGTPEGILGDVQARTQKKWDREVRRMKRLGEM